MIEVGGYRNMYGVADWLADEIPAASKGLIPSSNVLQTNNSGTITIDANNNTKNAAGNNKNTVLIVTPSPELASLRSKLGEANFLALGGDDQAVKVVFGSPGETGATAEVAQISDAGKLIDLYALVDLALKNEQLTPEKKTIFEKVQSSIKEKLGSLLGTGGCNAKQSAWDCFAQLTGNEIALLVAAGIIAILLVSLLMTVIFRRRCPPSGY